MKFFLVLILLSFWKCRNCNAQNEILELNPCGKKIAYYREFEYSIGDSFYTNDSRTLQSQGLAQPETYRRRQTGLPDLLVSYVYRLSDSLVAEIWYKWDDRTFTDSTKSGDLSYSLISKYKSIVSFISSLFGIPRSKGDLTDTSKLGTNEELTRIDSWEGLDHLSIGCYITLSEEYRKGSIVAITPTHRIRLYVECKD